MHKGKRTMLGRIMAGSQAVIAHNEAGHALFGRILHPTCIGLRALSSPVKRWPWPPGGPSLSLTARSMRWPAPVHATIRAGECSACSTTTSMRGSTALRPRKWGTLADGTKVSSGQWHVPRPDDPRHCVSVEPAEGQLLVYWGTPQVKAALETIEWPRVYRERNAIQEHSFKRMIDQGALETNEGRKTIAGPDRH